MEAQSHSARSAVGAVVIFALVLSLIAVFAGAGIAVVTAICVAGLALPLVIMAAIHRDERDVERLLRRTHQ